MSHHATNAPLRFLFATALWLGATASAFAQQSSPEITLKLSPAQVVEIARLIDCETPRTFRSDSPLPAAYWQLQVKIGQALDADPAARRAVLSAWRAAR